jgi:hypothetical protein
MGQPPKKKPATPPTMVSSNPPDEPLSTTRRLRPVLPCVSSLATGVGDWVGSSVGVPDVAVGSVVGSWRSIGGAVSRTGVAVGLGVGVAT